MLQFSLFVPIPFEVSSSLLWVISCPGGHGNQGTLVPLEVVEPSDRHCPSHACLLLFSTAFQVTGFFERMIKTTAKYSCFSCFKPVQWKVLLSVVGTRWWVRSLPTQTLLRFYVLNRSHCLQAKQLTTKKTLLWSCVCTSQINGHQSQGCKSVHFVCCVKTGLHGPLPCSPPKITKNRTKNHTFHLQLKKWKIKQESDKD